MEADMIKDLVSVKMIMFLNPNLVVIKFAGVFLQLHSLLRNSKKQDQRSIDAIAVSCSGCNGLLMTLMT